MLTCRYTGLLSLLLVFLFCLAGAGTASAAYAKKSQVKKSKPQIQCPVFPDDHRAFPGFSRNNRHYPDYSRLCPRWNEGAIARKPRSDD